MQGIGSSGTEIKNLGSDNGVTIFFSLSFLLFVVVTDIDIACCRFKSAVLRGKNWELPLPPFGQGW